MKKPASLLTIALLLTGCATAPSVQVLQQCPTLPELPPLPEAAQGPSFTERMQSLLSGSAETPISLSPPSTNAGQGIGPPKTVWTR